MSEKTKTEICPICSIEWGTPAGIVKIHDERKWLCSPDPCPECHKFSLERAREAGRKAREDYEKRILDAILRD